MRKIILLCVLWFVALPVVANELTIIPLKHRSADEVLPIIRPMLDQDAAASGMNYQLFIRTSPRNLEQIRQLLESIDTVPRRLRITVIQDVDSETRARLAELSGSVGMGRDARISVRGRGGGRGLSVDGRRGADRLTARVDSSQSLERDHKTQHIQVLEGNRALVRIGESVPVPQRQVIRHAWGTEVIDTTQYAEVGSGFYVLPRVNGDRVTLEISTQNDIVGAKQGDYPDMRIQHTSSIVSGYLGEWLEVGVTGQQRSNEDASLGGRSSSHLDERRSVLLKVEEVR